MRVISGRCKGRVLYSPKSKLIRPTSDKIKEFIFDYIGELVRDAVILDLYSGTGSLAIEALSRGAQFAVLIDNSIEAIQLIYRNLESTHLLAQGKIVKQDALRYLKKAIQQNSQYNLIFADPPYSINDYHNVIEYVGSDNLLQNGGFFILEHSSRKNVAASAAGLTAQKTKVFGDTSITFYKKKEN